MKQFLDTLRNLRDNGYRHKARTESDRISIPGCTMRFKMSDGFPLVTSRKMFIKSVIKELLWFISGSVDNNILKNGNVNIWTSWEATESSMLSFIEKRYPELDKESDEYKELCVNLSTKWGSIGPMYGMMWRNYPRDVRRVTTFNELAKDKQLLVTNLMGNADFLINAFGQDRIFDITPDDVACFIFGTVVDQLHELITELKTNPFSSRLIIDAWRADFLPARDLVTAENPYDNRGTLAPCHVLQQYFVKPAKNPGEKSKLSMALYQRSADFPIGVPTNIASYSLLLMMIAQCVDMEADEFIWIGGDTHIYANQLGPDLVDLQLSREPLPLPKMIINPNVKEITDFKFEDFELVDYKHHDKITYPISV